MSLIAVRERFARESGHHELVDDFAAGTYTDNGADFFINAGQRMLDRKASFLKSYSWYKKDATVGTYKLAFQYCTAVKEVWMMATGEARFELTIKDLNWIRANYGESYSTQAQGTPAYYAPISIGLSPEQEALTAVGGASPYTAQFTNDAEEITFGNHFAYNGILWMPPTDKTYTVSILGRFNSKTLATDTDVTWWTESHPDLLVLAAMWALEGFYRNTEGQRDYMTMISDAIGDLDRDVVEYEVQHINEMEG